MIQFIIYYLLYVIYYLLFIILLFSGQNNSDRRRWAYLIGYNRADNDPVYEHFCPGYTPMTKV